MPTRPRLVAPECCGAGPPHGRQSALKSGTGRAGHQQPWVAAPGSEFSLGQFLEHGLLQFGFRQKFLEPSVHLLQLGQPLGFLGLHAALQLAPAGVGVLWVLQGSRDVGNGLALGDQLLGRFELADDLLR